jgi:ligand-binding sensor domain-containing protein
MKLLFKIICLIFLLTTGVPSHAQTSLTSSGKYYLFKNYTTQNGLLDNDIYSLAQDRKGYVWIGSSLGLCRFDGKTFYQKAIPQLYDNPSVLTYMERTPDGTIISAGFMQGVFVQQDDGQFTQYLEGGRVELGKNLFKSIKYCPDSSILAATHRSLYLIKEGAMSQIYDYGSSMNLFNTLAIDKDGRIWFGGRLGIGMLQPSDTGYEPVFFPELQNKLIGHLLFDDEGTLHVATIQGYYRIKWQKSGLWNSDYTIEQPFHQLKDIYINRPCLDKERNLWIPTDSYGIFRTKGDSVSLHLTKENGLISSAVTCMMQDKEGNYWFGTNDGISMVGDFDNFAIGKDGARFKEASEFIVDEYQRIWMYSRSALYVYQDDELIEVSLKGTPVERAGIRLIEINNSEMMISNDVGLYKIPISKSLPDMRKMEKLAEYAAHGVMALLHAMKSDSEGVWVCSATKLCNYYDRQFLPVKFNHADSVSLSPRRMIRDRYGYYWCANYTNGIFRGAVSRPGKNKVVFDVHTEYKSVKADSTFVTAWIRDMTFDREGNLWFSSLYTGVYKVAIDSSGVVSHKLYSTADGLITNNVYGISFDDEGRVWFLTQRGISILKRDSNGVESITRLDVNDGIAGMAFSHLQVGGRLFLLTDEGVFITQNQLFKEKSEKTPKVFITNLLINGVTDPKFTANTNNLRLSHNQDNITIEFSAITFRNAADVRYQYKLEGAGDDWSVLSDRGFVEYASLRPGRYTFKVQAPTNSPEGGGNPPPSEGLGEAASLSFRIAPAYYQTVWFYLLITMAVFALLYVLYTYRLRQAIRMERIRMRIASDLHDDIGSTLSSISLISEMASRHDTESELAKVLAKI